MSDDKVRVGAMPCLLVCDNNKAFTELFIKVAVSLVIFSLSNHDGDGEDTSRADATSSGLPACSSYPCSLLSDGGGNDDDDILLLNACVDNDDDV